MDDDVDWHIGLISVVHFVFNVYVLLPCVPVRDMSNQFSEDLEGKKVVGFEVPASPDSSYNSVFPSSEDEAREPPLVPQQLQSSLLVYPASRDGSEGIQPPMNVVLNHLYIENRDAPRSVVALGFTHRFHSKYVSVVLYKAVQRRGGSSS